MMPTVETNSELAPNSRVAVVGAGITGLSAAYYLHRQRPDLQITILEVSSRAGGILQTVQRDGFLIERGPDMFVTRESEALALCEELGFAEQLIQTNPNNRGAYLVHRGKLHKMPAGWTMMTPTNLWAIARTPLLSWKGKLRVLWELFARKRKDTSDESLASFTRRRLGYEAFDNIIQPLIGGIYTADPEKLSMNATLKSFADMEREGQGLIRGGIKLLKSRKGDSTSSGARYSMFVTPKDGMQSLADKIVDALPDGTIEHGVKVSGITESDNGLEITIDGETTSRQFDKVVLTTSSQITAKILEAGFAEISQRIGQIPLAGASVLSMGYARKDVEHPLDAFGVVCPIQEERPLIAISISSEKFAGRAPEDHVLFRVFIGGALQPELLDLNDEELIESTRQQLKELLGVQGDPLFTEIARWTNSMPQYHVGHVELVEEIESLLESVENLEIAGNAYRGVGIPVCIREGKLAAERLINATTKDTQSIRNSAKGQSRLQT